MRLQIDNRSGIPIYDQIFSQLRDQIIDGTLQAEEQLPSIRNLAKDLRISVITTKRAYEELEREGFIYSMPGKGFYVGELNAELVREHHLKEIEEHLDAAVRLAGPIGLREKELSGILHTLWEDSNERN